MSGGGASSWTYLVDEELQLDDGGSAVVLAVAFHTGPSEPESVAGQGRNKLWTTGGLRRPGLEMSEFTQRHLQPNRSTSA